MLRRCETDGCETWTLGELCLEHEPPPPHQPRRSTAADDAPAVVGAMADSGDGACRPGDFRFPLLLRASVGFRVVTPFGRLGRVARLSLDGRRRPVALLVRTGLFRQRLIEVPVSGIDWIVPAGRRVLLADAPEAAEGRIRGERRG